MTFNKNSNFSYVGLGQLETVFSEVAIGEGVAFSRIQFPTDVVPIEKYEWTNKKYKVTTSDGEFIKTKEELVAMPNFKSDIIIDPVLELKKRTFTVIFDIEHGGEFTGFFGKEEQTFTETVAGAGVSFSEVEFPAQYDINAEPYWWNGETFRYNGNLTTKAELITKKFTSNVTISLVTQIRYYTAVFTKTPGFFFDRNDYKEIEVEAEHGYKLATIPRVDLGLTNETKVYSELYKFSNKWHIHKVDESDPVYKKAGEFIKELGNNELSDYVFDKNLALVPMLAKKEINVVFAQDESKYSYPSGFAKVQPIQVENIGDTSISANNISFTHFLICKPGFKWDNNKFTFKQGSDPVVTGTPTELSNQIITKGPVVITPIVIADVGIKPAEFDTKVALTENDKEYWIKASDKANWDNNQEVEGWDDVSKAKKTIKKLTILEAYTHPVIDRGEGHFNIRPYDIPKWERGEKIMGEFRGSLMEIQWIPDVQYYTLAINHWDGNTYKIHPGNKVRYDGRAEVNALNSSNAVVKIKKKTPEEDGFTLQVKHFGNGNRYNIKPEDKSKWDSYQEVDCCNMETELKPVIKYKNIRISELFDTEIWLKGKKYYIMHGSGWTNNDYTTEIACWDGYTQYETQYEVTKLARENLSTTYTKDVKMDGKTWKINPADETKWNNRTEIPAWNGTDPWCKNLITRPNYDTIYTVLVTNRDNKKYYIEPGHDEDWKKSIELDGTTEEDRNTKIKVKRIHPQDIYTTLVFDEEHYKKYYIKPEDVRKWNNFEKVYGITQYNMDNLFWDDSVIQQYRKLHMNEKFTYEIEQNGKKYYLRTSDDVMSYYEFIQVKAWKGVIDDFLDENAYETIKRPDWTPPVKSDTPTTPGKVKVTFWGGPNCDFTDMTNPNTIELTEDQPDGASLENLTFPHIKFKPFIRTDIGYGLKEGEWKISYVLNGKWKTLQRVTSSIKKIITKGNVLIQPNPGKQR